MSKYEVYFTPFSVSDFSRIGRKNLPARITPEDMQRLFVETKTQEKPILTTDKGNEALSAFTENKKKCTAYAKAGELHAATVKMIRRCDDETPGKEMFSFFPRYDVSAACPDREALDAAVTEYNNLSTERRQLAAGYIHELATADQEERRCRILTFEKADA